MANHKTFKGRISNKHDTSTNWLTASNNGFTPLDGEIIIYDDLNRIKIGDGSTKVDELPFLNYSEEEINNLIQTEVSTNYLPLTGGTLTGPLSIDGNFPITIDATNGWHMEYPGYGVESNLNEHGFICINGFSTLDANTVNGFKINNSYSNKTIQLSVDNGLVFNNLSIGLLGDANKLTYGSKVLANSSGIVGSATKPVYVSDTNGTLSACKYTLGAACAKGVTDSSSASTIGTGTNLPTERDIYYGLPFINEVHNYNFNTSIYAPTTVGTSGQILKSNGSGEPTWVDGASLLAPKKITLVATAGQTSFSIPFEYDSLSSNLTVYFNGILMKEADNYTVDTSNNTVNLVGFSAEAGDVITIMGLLGAQSIDFGQEAINAINQINTAVDNAKSELQAAVDQASIDIDNLVKQLPSNWDDYLNKNANNVMNSGSKITMASDYAPSNNQDVVTKSYVDNATSAIVTDIYKASSTAPTNTKLLWVDTGNSNILKYHNGSGWTPVVVAWS